MNHKIKLNLVMDCLSCPEFVVLDRTNKLYSYSDNSPSIITGDITCTHHSICPNMIGKEKIFEILDRIE